MTVQMSAKASMFSSGTARPCALRLTDPNFGGRQTIVFQKRPFQLNFGTQLFSHLADRTGESAGTAIGHGPEQTSRVVVPLAQAKRRGTFSQQLDFQFAPHD